LTRPWETLDSFDTEAGQLQLRRRGEGEFLITLAGRVLMNSAASRSESPSPSSCAGLAGAGRAAC
jgi:hypothetical protein